MQRAYKKQCNGLLEERTFCLLTDPDHVAQTSPAKTAFQQNRPASLSFFYYLLSMANGDFIL